MGKLLNIKKTINFEFGEKKNPACRHKASFWFINDIIHKNLIDEKRIISETLVRVTCSSLIPGDNKSL